MQSTAIVSTNYNLQAVQPGGTNPARVYLAGLESDNSKRTMRAALATVAAVATGADIPESIDAQWELIDSTPWGALRFQHTAAIRAALAGRYSAGNASKMLSALRGVLKSSWRLGQMTADEYLAAVDIPGVKGEKPDHAAGRAITLGELMALVASCQDGTPRGARDAAMLAVAYSCGLRRQEIVSLDLQHYDAAAAVLRVTGKRNKTRTVPIQNGARAALEDWIDARGSEAGPLFWHVRKGGALVNRRLTTQAVYTVFADHARRAGVKEFSPHDMRRTFAGDLLDAGADIVTVQKMMGHTNVSTTAGYDRRGERAKQDAAKRLHFPYSRKAK